jgi:hypothetical protein
VLRDDSQSVGVGSMYMHNPGQAQGLTNESSGRSHDAIFIELCKSRSRVPMWVSRKDALKLKAFALDPDLSK